MTRIQGVSPGSLLLAGALNRRNAVPVRVIIIIITKANVLEDIQRYVIMGG